MSMNEELASFYGTAGYSNEDLEKQASVETFAKLAADHGIDLTQMSNEAVDALYAEVYPEFAKQAQEEEKKKKKENGDDDDDDDEEEKKESAARAWQEKVAFQEKFAESDFMGRIMAHSFTQELNLIKEGGIVGKALKGGGKLLERLGKGAVRTVGRTGGAEQAMNPRTAKLIGGGIVAGGAAGTAAGAKKLLSKKKGETEKKSSAQQFEELAANQAVKIAAAAGYDVEQAQQLVGAVYTLGLDETEKVAQVQNLDDAIHVRGLEYLEAVGYPVNWNEVFGG